MIHNAIIKKNIINIQLTPHSIGKGILKECDANEQKRANKVEFAFAPMRITYGLVHVNCRFCY